MTLRLLLLTSLCLLPLTSCQKEEEKSTAPVVTSAAAGTTAPRSIEDISEDYLTQMNAFTPILASMKDLESNKEGSARFREVLSRMDELVAELKTMPVPEPAVREQLHTTMQAKAEPIVKEQHRLLMEKNVIFKNDPEAAQVLNETMQGFSNKMIEISPVIKAYFMRPDAPAASSPEPAPAK